MSPVLAIIKSSGNPLFDIAGAYFPAWLACAIAGAAGVWLLQRLARAIGIEAALRPPIVMLPAAFVAVTCAVWLLFFSTR